MDKWLNHPTVLKILALALGILLWAVVHFDPTSPPNSVAELIETRTISGVKVQPYGMDERSYVLNNLQPQTVKLMVRGTRSDLLAAQTDDYRVQVDLSSVSAGEHSLPLRIDLPRGVQLVESMPSAVTVSLEELQTKEFEVQVTTKGEPKAGLKAGTPILRPTNRVHVTLPADELDSVDYVGAAVSITGVSETLKNKSVKLEAYDANGRVIKGALIDPAVLDVEVPITNPFKTVPLQFKLVGKMPPGLSIASFQPDTDTATIYGAQSELDKVDFLEADVRLNELTKSGKVSVPLSVPRAITEVSPTQVNIDVQVVLSQVRLIQGLPVDINGLGSGLHLKITDPATGKVDITVQGAPVMLDKLQPGDVNVAADATGKGPGTYTLPLVVNSPQFIDQAGGNLTITVDIAADLPAEASPSPSLGPDQPVNGGVNGGGASGGTTDGSASGGNGTSVADSGTGSTATNTGTSVSGATPKPTASQ